jgi:hypothetical protein
MPLPLAIAFPILPSCSTSIGPLLNRVLGIDKKFAIEWRKSLMNSTSACFRAYRELAENEPRRVILIDGRISPNTFAQRFPDLGKHQTPKTKLQTS